MSRFVALWLAFGLAWPSPAVALRPRAGGLEERTAVTAELTQQLAPTAIDAGPSTALGTGLEERPNINQAGQAAIEKALSTLPFLRDRGVRRLRGAAVRALIAHRPPWLGYLSAKHLLAAMAGRWPEGLDGSHQQAIGGAFTYGMTRRRFGAALTLGAGAPALTVESPR